MAHRWVILAHHLYVHKLRVVFTFLMVESKEEECLVSYENDRPSNQSL